jgi:hypothetical protein
MSILLQNHDENRQMLGELEGIDILLQQLAVNLFLFFFVNLYFSDMNLYLFSIINDMILKQMKNLNIWKIYLVVYVHH